MLVSEILDDLETIGNRKSHRYIWAASLFYHASIMLSRYGIRKTVGQREAITFYSLLFASSGIGKSFSISQVEKMFKLENYTKAMLSFYENNISALPEAPDDYDDVIRYMPKSTTLSLDGTKEGLYSIAYAQSMSGYGSLNLYTDEFGDIISSSTDMLNKVKELYDGTYKAKIVKGNNDSSIKPDIKNIICNMIAIGTKSGISSEDAKELKKIVTSGLYRRSWVIDIPIADIEINDLDSRQVEIANYIAELDKNYKDIFLYKIQQDYGNRETYIEVTNDYSNRLKEIDKELIDRANSDKLNQFKQYDTGSLELIIDLSYIIGVLEASDIIDVNHLEQAYDFFNETRETVAETFTINHPYKSMYNLLMQRNNMTITEMIEFDDTIPMMKTKVADNVAMLSELCYRHGKVLNQTMGKVVRYSIEELEENDLTNLIVSVHDEEDGAYAINFKPFETSWEMLKKIVVSSNIESFVAAHFEASLKAPDGHRKQDCYISGANLIIFDIDNGLSLEEASSLLQPYKYIFYTTKSHRSEKSNGEDRFRIIMPTKTNFYIEPAQHKELYINLEQFIGLKKNDTQTRNVSRLWFTNPEAEVFENEGDLLDVTPFLPGTEKAEAFLPKLNALSANYEPNMSDNAKRIVGMKKHCLLNAAEGSRNISLFNLATFILYLGEQPEEHVYSVNQMLSKPIDDTEIKQILRSAERT
jgi:hypothetical protein